MSQLTNHLITRRAQREKIKAQNVAKKAKKTVRLFDTFVIATSVISPIMTIPQLITIWSQRRAQDVSLYTWGAYLCGSVVWMMYGILHKEKPIIYSNSLLLVVNALIVIGILLYK